MPTKIKASPSSPSPDSGSDSSNPAPSLAWESVVPSLPSEPGVYWFSDADKKVLYVGKAKNLKNRVTSYRQLNQLSARIFKMVNQAVSLKFEVLESELEALLVEAELIRIHRPPFNVALKDDKSPLYIHITTDLYPRVETIRKKDLIVGEYKGSIFGPFPSGYKVKKVLQLIRPIFPWCNQAGNPQKNSKNKHKACFYYHLELCPGACVENISPTEYSQNIKHLKEFLRGHKGQVLRDLKSEMKQAVSNEKFEKAATFRDQINLIKTVTHQNYRLSPQLTLPQLRDSQIEEGLVQLQDILSQHLHLPKQIPLHRIEAYDVSNTQGKEAAVAMVVATDGKADPGQYRLFNIRTLDTPNDFWMMREALTRRQNHPEWGIPDLVVVDGGKGQVSAVRKNWTWKTPVIGIAKNPDRLVIPLPQPKDEKPGRVKYSLITLPPNHPSLTIIQRLRDEAHRFSKKQHQKRAVRKLLG